MMFGSLFERIRTGLRVAKASFGVLRREYWLLVFPVLYGIAWLAGAVGLVAGIFVALVGAGYGLAAVDQVAALSEGQAETTVTALLIAASVLFMFVATAVATFFSAALVHSVGSLFAGESTSLRDGLAGAWEAKRTILAWGAVGTAVGLVFRALESREGTAARLARSVAGFAWFAMTFFIVPVIVFEDVSITSMFSKSASAFRDTWGETLGAGFGITLVVTLVGIVLAVGALAVSIPVAAVFPGPGILLTILLLGGVIAFTYLLSQTIWGVAKTALYVYAVEGTRPDQFDDFDFETLGGRAEGSASPGRAGSRDTLDP